MSFMQPEIYFGEYYVVEANHGEMHIVPVDASGIVETYADLSDYVDGSVDNPEDKAEIHKGWLCRLSAPGYMDCTDWSVFGTLAEAEEYLSETYYICVECGEDEEECTCED